MAKNIKISFLWLLITMLSNFVSYGINKDKVISFNSLLKEMIDRDRLPISTNPNFTTKQFSSYDRNTVIPGNQTWYANWDRSNFIRVELDRGKKEYVMMDTQDPGAIVRFWMTFAGKNAGEGILRIYFDGNPKPEIEGTAFDILSGGQLTGKPLSSSVSELTDYKRRGHNLYLPLPYAKSCKVTYESEHVTGPGGKKDDERIYYNINYRSYDPAVKVITFKMEDLQKEKESILLVQNTLLNPKNSAQKSEFSEKIPSQSIETGKSLEKVFTGNKAITGLNFRIKATNLEQALRTTVLEISFDGQQTVWCPIGDFFGTGYQIRAYDTWFSKVDKEGTMSAKWVMPFKNSCHISIHNMGDYPVEILEGEIKTTKWKWNNESMYFGASWHQYTKIDTGDSIKNMDGKGNPFDINYTKLEGEGIYVGDVLVLFNTEANWWGEGDEKVYVDKEQFPSHIGTGTEDYYGYAWCRPENFTNHPFISQPDGSGNLKPGYTVNIRYRSLDGIPFKKSLTFDMELWHWTKASINYAITSFWYIKQEGKCLIKPDIEGVRAKVALKRSDIVP